MAYEAERKGYRQATAVVTAASIDVTNSDPPAFGNTVRAIQGVAEEILVDSFEKGGFEALAEAFKNYSMALAIMVASAHTVGGLVSLEDRLAHLQHLALDAEAGDPDANGTCG